jgi:hypothetical protein
VFLSAARPSAHRLDEYLQAARLGIDPDRVEIALDLTPGITVASEVVNAIDRDANGSITADEARVFADEVLRAVALDLDDVPLRVVFVDCAVPAIDAVLGGDGAIRIRATAAVPQLVEGRHHLRFRNDYRPAIGVYLANALLPASDRIAVAAQRRNVDQRDLTVDYNLRAEPAARVRRGVPLGVAGAFVVALQVWRRRRPRESA